MTSPPPSSPQNPREPSWREALAIPLGLLGAILGAVIGGFIYYLLLVRAGMMAPFVVGVFVGIGTRWLARRGSIVLAIVAFIIAIIGSVIAEWSTLPAPPPLFEYLRHAQQAFSTFGWALALIGAIIAAFFTWAAPPRP